MARLPIVGGDDGDWGGILNEYLLEGHNLDGSHNSSDIKFKVNNIEELRSFNRGKAEMVSVLGYYDSGDGGGGDFYYSFGKPIGTYNDNGGTIIVPNEGDGSEAWLRLFSGSLNVKWFGAKGDGVTNDTSIISVVLSLSNYIYLPQGTYIVTSDIFSNDIEWSGPGVIEYNGGGVHSQYIGSNLHVGDYRNVGGEKRADQSSGIILGGKTKGYLLGASEHPFWQLWRGIGDEGSLLLNLIPNVPVVNATSASYNSGGDTKLTAGTGDFSDKSIWAVGSRIHFNLNSYRIKSRLDDNNIVIGKDDGASYASVAFTESITDNCIMPVFFWSVDVNVSGTTVKIINGDHPPKFSTYDINHHLPWIYLDGGWRRINSVTDRENFSVDSSPGDGAYTGALMKLHVDYAYSLAIQRAAGSGLEEKLKIQAGANGYIINSASSGVGVTKPLLLQMDGNTVMKIQPDEVISEQNTTINGSLSTELLVPKTDAEHDIGSSLNRYKFLYAENVRISPPSSSTPSNNGEVSFELTSNTELTIKVKGSDGVVRSAVLNLS